MATDADILNQFKTDLDSYYRTTESVMTSTFDALESALDEDFDIVDTSSPFVFLVEASATHAAGAMNKFETVARKIYPRLAREMEDLYDHMADEDLLDRFATPSKTKFIFGFNIASLKEIAVWDASSGVFRVRIPKDTQIKYGGVMWMIHYPIDITITKDGIIQPSYDFSIATPLQPIDQLALKYTTVKQTDKVVLMIEIPVEQIAITTSSTPISPSTPFTAKLRYNDQFLYLRAYYRGAGTVWTEMNVTHSLSVYDINKPTMRIQVSEGAVSVGVPDIYAYNEEVGAEIRIDIFTTKGKTEIDLSDYSSEDASIAWVDLGENTTVYEDAIVNVTQPVILAQNSVISGRNALGFEELKERVIYRSADKRASITPTELAYSLSDRGYVLTVSNDTLRSRLYSCSRDLLAPSSYGIPTPIGVRNAPIVFDGNLSNLEGIVFTSGTRTTISNKALYREKERSTAILTVDELTALEEMKVTAQDSFIREINTGKYFYSPFFYVLEHEAGIYQARPYYLDDTKSTGRSFVKSNRKIPFTIYTEEVTVTRTGTKYTISTTAAIPNGVSGLRAQIHHKDANDQRFHINNTSAVYETGYVTFTFELETSFDIDTKDQIEIINFITKDNNETNAYVPLDSTFDLFYYKDSQLVAPTEFDYLIVANTASSWVAASYETVTVRLGSSMEGLHVRAEPIEGEVEYLRYSSDQFARFPEDQVLRDEDGRMVLALEDGKPVPVIEYHKGDIIPGPDGNAVKIASAGDRVVVNGEYVRTSDATLAWSLTPMTVDARYRYGETDRVINYRNYIGGLCLEFLEQDLRPMEKNLIARTDLELLPKGSMGSVLANVGNDIVVSVPTSLAFSVDVLLTRDGFVDEAMKISLRTAIGRVIRETLYTSTYSHSQITHNLQALSSSIISISFDSPIGEYNTATITDSANVFSLSSRLYRKTNGVLDVEDDVSVSFSGQS